LPENKLFREEILKKLLFSGACGRKSP